MDHWLIIHGTYPQDYGPYKLLKELSHDEAAELVQATDKAKAEEYMWLNKGFILLGHLGVRIPHDQRREKIVPGVQAVYLHDGKYRLIEFMSRIQIINNLGKGTPG